MIYVNTLYNTTIAILPRLTSLKKANMIPLWLHYGTAMANLTIKNIPENLYQTLKKRAELNRRSMNAEVLVCLEEILFAPQLDAATFLPRIRKLRAKSARHLLTDEEILKIKNQERS